MRVVALVAAAAIVSGCAAKVVSSSQRSVMIDAKSWSADKVQQMADAECAKHGRVARMVSLPRYSTNEYLFDCVH